MTRRVRPANRRPGPRMAELVAERDAAVKRAEASEADSAECRVHLRRIVDLAGELTAELNRSVAHRDSLLDTVEAQRKELAELESTYSGQVMQLAIARDEIARRDHAKCRTCAKQARCSLTKLGSGQDWTCGYWAATT